MKTEILTARIDDETGELGYCLDSLPNMDGMVLIAYVGRTIAHDLLEHQNGVHSIGSYADELQALGALWFIRGQSADLSRDGRGSMYSPEETLAFDIARQVRDHLYRDESLPLLDYDPEHECADVWESIIEHARKIPEYEDYEYEKHAEAIEEYLARAPALLAMGWDKAVKRFKSAQDANTLFWNIADALDPYVKHVDHEGQQIELTYCEDKLTAFACEHYPESEENELGCDDCGDWFEPDGREYVNPQGYIQCGDCREQEEAA